ncbi:hypothetical protein [Alistipes putredinis]|uniref:hypothetical protein n=1 Tax=Alistipes putredinis TaxID=28117 RepID=UPI0039672382
MSGVPADYLLWLHENGKSSRYTLKTRSRTSWPTRPFACLIYPPHSASISKCTFC